MTECKIQYGQSRSYNSIAHIALQVDSSGIQLLYKDKERISQVKRSCVWMLNNKDNQNESGSEVTNKKKTGHCMFMIFM